MFTDVTLLLQTGGYLVKEIYSGKKKKMQQPQQKGSSVHAEDDHMGSEERQGSLRHAHHSPFGAAQTSSGRRSWRQPRVETQKVRFQHC